MEYEMDEGEPPREGTVEEENEVIQEEETHEPGPEPIGHSQQGRKAPSFLGKAGVFNFKVPKFAWAGDQGAESQKANEEGASLPNNQQPEEDTLSRKPKPILKSRVQEDDSNQSSNEAENYEFDISNTPEKKWNALGWFRSRSRPQEEEPVHEINDAIAVVSLRHLEMRIYNLRLLIMVIALMGLAVGISIQEYCWLGYIPTAEEQTGYCNYEIYTNSTACHQSGNIWTPGIVNPLDMGEFRCQDRSAELLKGLCTILTIALMLTIFHMYQCLGKGICMRNHLEYRGPQVNLPFWTLGLTQDFCLEIMMCIVHPIPLLSFTFAIQAEGRVSVYRIESVLVSLMFLRLYTVWRYFREWLFARYTSKHIVSRLSDIAMDSKLAIKAILDDIPFETLAFLFVFSTVVLAYLVRIAEAPVNVEQLYFWNQLWLVVVTSASVGYGDIYPQTNLGRFLCFIAMLMGAFIIAVLTVTVSSKLTLNAGESRLLQFLQSEKWEKDIKVAATRSIQFWWRLSIQHPRTLQALRDFRNKKKAYRKFLEATPHFGVFVQQMKEDQGRVAETLSKIESKVEPKPASTENSPASKAAARQAPVSAQVFDDLMQQMLQLQKTNEQLMQIIAQAKNNPGGGVILQHAGRGPPIPARPNAGAKAGDDAALIASAAVEERVKRMEAQIVNLDKGMAKCLGQVVRLIQGLY